MHFIVVIVVGESNKKPNESHVPTFLIFPKRHKETGWIKGIQKKGWTRSNTAFHIVASKSYFWVSLTM